MKKLIIGLAATASILIAGLIYLYIPKYTSVCVQKCTRETRYFQNIVETKDHLGNRMVIIHHKKHDSVAGKKLHKIGLNCVSKEGYPLPTWNAIDITDVGAYTEPIERAEILAYKVGLANQFYWVLRNLPISKDYYYIEYDRIIFRSEEMPPPEWGAEVRFEWEIGKILLEAGKYKDAKCVNKVIGENDEVLEYIEF